MHLVEATYAEARELSVSDLHDLSPAELTEDLHSETRAVGRADRRRLTRIAALYAKRIWETDHTSSRSPHYDSHDTSRGAAHDMAAWVSQHLGISRYKAKRMVDCSLAIERLPRLSVALQDGVLNLDKVMELARYVTLDTERKEISWARQRSLATIKARADERCRLDDQEATDKRNDRFMDESISDGLGYLTLCSPADIHMQIVAAVDARVATLAPCPSDERPGYEPGVQQLRADALVELILTGSPTATGGSQTAGARHKPEIVIFTSLDEDGFGNGVDGRGTVLHPSTVEKLCCDSRLRFVLTDEQGNALGIGERSPVVPHWLRLAVLKAFDLTCVFPGCDCRGSLDVHHLLHWTRGGLTDHDNLAPMCRRHHALLHEHEWHAYKGADGNIVWFRPDGRQYLPGPAPPLSFAA